MDIKAKCIVALGAFIILSVMGYIFLPRDEIIIQSTEQVETENEYIYIHIEGCVNEPGLKKVLKGTRIYEAIEISGGETSDADTSKINLSSIVSDEQKIYIPSKVILTIDQNVSIKSENNDTFVNINTATIDELQKLNGIGPSMAQKIIDYRENEGYFSNIEDIKNVSGIGESKYNTIKNEITI